MGCTLKGNHESIEWRKVESNPADVPLCLSKDMALLSGLEMPKHISKLPNWVLHMFGLETLSLNCCGQIEYLPLEELIKFPFLSSIDLSGCGNLWSPPQEICNQGGEATMQFLCEVKKSGKFNKIMNLFLLGDGEAGKTSVVMALKSKINRAAHIRADHRTVGIDITTWNIESSDLDFRIYDFAGQPVYAKTHQHFLAKRALYLFIWRALPGLMDLASIVKSVKFWLESLQNRMPGSYVMLVVTHIDQVDSVTLQRQRALVQSTVCNWLAQRNCSLSGDETRPLQVWKQGESIPVNCISGDGIPILRESVLSFASDMPWYREALPFQWIQLQKQLEISKLLWKFIPLSKYSVLAAKCGVTGSMLGIVTKFMHESGVIRFFGDFNQCKSADMNSSDLLKNVVFISIPWMIDVMKGLLCHDRQALIDFFSWKQDKEMLLRLNMLNKYGRLHKALLPFLWPSRNQCKEFWNYLCTHKKREREIWKHNTISNRDELDCAVAVLAGFDQVADQGSEFLVPGALAPARFPSMPAIDVDECPYRILYHYHALPPGAFDSIVIRTANNGCRCAQITSFLAVFYDKAGDICQIFFLSDEASPDTEKLILRSSSKKFLEQAEKEVLRMEKQFGGLRRQHRDEHQKISPANIRSFVWKGGEGRFCSSSEITCVSCVLSHKRNPHVFNKKVYFKIWQQILGEGSSCQMISCPECRFQHRAVDILTTCSISDAETMQCPCCQQFGKDSEPVFSSQECRLLINLSSNRDEVTVTCFACMQNGRIGQIRVLDLVREEVFVSGLTALKCDMQISIKNTLQQIEIEADVGCCGRLDGLKESLVAVLLLSDSYIHCKQCKQEFISAMRSCQGLIPILLPDTGTRTEQGVSFGWTGPSDGEYWRHAVEVAHSEERVDWSLLRHFAPIQYPLALTSDRPLKHDQVEFARLISAEINNRIQRDGKINTYTEISILGVRLSYFDIFVEKFGGLESFQGLTTEQVMQRFVKPVTEKTRLSLCEQLVSEGLHSYVGNAEWFYSHAWKYQFLDVVSSVKSHFEGGGVDPLIWFDLFSISQHKTESRPFEWWNSAFLIAIGNIGKVLMLVQPYEDPKTGIPAWITLSRVWCVFELYACESTLSHFEVVMTRDMSARFLADLDVNPSSVLSILEGIDCTECVSSNKEDQERVFEVINRTVGFQLLDSTVMRVMERWMYATLLSLKKSEQLMETLKIMESMCSRCLEIRQHRLGEDHPDSANSKRILLLIQRMQTDSEFLKVLLEKGWVTHELEEFQKAEHVKALEEEEMLIKKADEVARLAAEEKADTAADDELRKKEELERILAQQVAAAAEEVKSKTEVEEEPEKLLAQQAARKLAQPKAHTTGKCCSIS